VPADAALTDATQALGRHALPLFFLALGALLVAVGGIGWVVLHRAHRDERARHATPLPRLVIRLTVGFGVIVAAALVFAVIANALDPGHALDRLDFALSTAVVDHASAHSRQVFARVTHLGDPLTLAVVCVAGAIVLVLRRERTLAFGLVVAIAGNAVLNRALKSVFLRVRPPPEQAVPPIDGWSFPSGHSSGAIVAYGMLAYVLIRTTPRAWHLPALLLAAAMAFTTGCSRVFLRAHYPSDVVAGFASGAAWLAICITSVEIARHYRRAKR
jgi:undecaprenyl-diphosphatase